MSSVSVSKKAERNAFLTVLAIFSMGQIAGSIDAAIELIGQAFSLSSSTTMYVSSVAALASVIVGLVIGFIAGKKVTYKAIVYCAGVCVLAGGLLPFFTNSFAILLVLRVVFGLGYGAMMSLENTFAALTLSKEKQATALGIGMFVGYGMNCILQFVGGLLADIQWNYVFLNHLFLIIPFVIILVCCPDIPNTPAEKAEGKKERSSFPPVIYIMCILMALVGLLISPLLIGCSFLSAAINPSATVAGVVAVCFSLGCMIGGLVYPTLSRKLGRYSFTCSLLIATVGVAGSAVANNIPLLCVVIFLGGMGFSTTQASAMMVTGASVSKSSVALASSLIMACFNLGMFLCSPFQAMIGNITGDALYNPLKIGAVVYLICAVFFAVYNPFKKQEA